jgi:hypothetical protein
MPLFRVVPEQGFAAHDPLDLPPDNGERRLAALRFRRTRLPAVPLTRDTGSGWKRHPATAWDGAFQPYNFCCGFAIQ